MTVSSLDSIADSLREATHPGQIPRDVSGIYPSLGAVVDMIRTLQSATNRFSEAVSALPGIVDGLRIDNIGDPIAPEQIRDAAANELADATLALDRAQAAADRACQLMSRLYLDTDD